MKDYPPYLDYPKPYKPMTNGDRIRSMTDEELAEFNISCPFIDEECTMKGCYACILEWLKQPCEVDHDTD